MLVNWSCENSHGANYCMKSVDWKSENSWSMKIEKMVDCCYLFPRSKTMVDSPSCLSANLTWPFHDLMSKGFEKRYYCFAERNCAALDDGSRFGAWCEGNA